MFTTVKKYGAYVVTKENVFTSEINDHPEDNVFASQCAVPPYWSEFTLISIEKYNHDTNIFKFCLSDGKQRLNLPVGGFLLALTPGNSDNADDYAIRPYTSITDDDANKDLDTGYFEILCKRYDQWGVKESVQTHFLFTRTDHSYKPPGVASNYIHKLKIGDTLKFKHNARCVGRIHYPFSSEITSLTMIAVGVGIAPMIHTLRTMLKCDDNNSSDHIKIVLLYGVRTVADILMREQLDAWQEQYSDRFKVVYCVGSRWTNIHWGAKTKQEYVPPPPPIGFNELKNAELGWVNDDKIRRHAFPPSNSTKLLVCGLPGVYEKLCGDRYSEQIAERSVLHYLHYTSDMVIKL